jgi:tRNA pseudouridine38-40 synthase
MHPDYVLPQRRAFVWPVGRINWQAMDRAAGYLVGEHDFSAFQNVGTLVKDPVRTLFAITRGQTLSSHEMVWQFCANGFLKQMVRNLMGSLVEVGRGKLAPEDILSLLHTGDRRLLPATAPAKGLCLTRVVYSFESESLTTAS